jgi:hypothetical protein
MFKYPTQLLPGTTAFNSLAVHLQQAAGTTLSATHANATDANRECGIPKRSSKADMYATGVTHVTSVTLRGKCGIHKVCTRCSCRPMCHTCMQVCRLLPRRTQSPKPFKRTSTSEKTNGRAPRPDQCETAAKEFVTAKSRAIYLGMEATAGGAALGTPAWASEFYRSCEARPITNVGGFSAGGKFCCL